jgi:hypothetical protein
MHENSARTLRDMWGMGWGMETRFVLLQMKVRNAANSGLVKVNPLDPHGKRRRPSPAHHD